MLPVQKKRKQEDILPLHCLIDYEMRSFRTSLFQTSKFQIIVSILAKRWLCKSAMRRVATYETEIFKFLQLKESKQIFGEGNNYIFVAKIYLKKISESFATNAWYLENLNKQVAWGREEREKIEEITKVVEEQKALEKLILEVDCYLKSKNLDTSSFLGNQKKNNE